MTASRLAAAALALAALGQAQVADAASPQCLTEAEVAGLAAYALPSAMQGVMHSCAARLSPQGFFATQGPALVARYAARKDAAWPAARTAFFKIGADKDDKTTQQMAQLPDAALKPFVDGMIAQMAGDEIKPKTCGEIERATSLLAPLPPENTSSLIGFVLTIIAQDDKSGKSKLPVCRAPA